MHDFVEGEPVVLPAHRLMVDHKLIYGQNRALSVERVAERRFGLERDPPVGLLQLFVWLEPGVALYLFLLSNYQMRITVMWCPGFLLICILRRPFMFCFV